MNKMVVTNLRLPENDWLQIKTIAAELGMSINEYLNYLIQDLSAKRQLSPNITKRNFVWDLDNLAGIKNKPLGALSKEDKIIYG